MKNLFKNLMLVAVAAMAFVACSEVSVEVDNLVKKTVINGTASINTDDTRSGFVGSETNENGNTVYKSAWDGDENIKVFNGSQEITTTIDAEGKFTVELEGTPDFITLCSPAKAWGSAYTFTIPAEQTPRTDSVDPAAHILQCQNAMVTNGTVNAKMQHQVGYGKMTVNTPTEFVIDYVEVELNGDWYGARTLKYTINADNVEGNVFWFATDVVEVSDFTVTAYDAERNAYTKSVTIPEGRELKFQYGRVSTFSVSNLEEVAAPDTVMDSATYYYNYNNLGGYNNWGYIVFEDATLGTLVLNVSLPNGLYLDVDTYLSGPIDIGLSRYAVTGGSLKGLDYNYYNNMIVTVVDGKYHITLDFKNTDGDILNATYVGDIVDFGYPDLRTKLPTPVVTPTISGKTITMNWNAVENAESYYITCTSGQDFEPISTTDTTVTITVSAYEYHRFSIKAVVSDDNENYRSSDETYVEYNDPREELPSPSNVTATIDGPNATISWDDVEGADGYQVYYWLDGEKRIDVDGTSITLELGYSVQNLYIYVFAIADEDNDEFRSSQSYDASVVINTGKDPNVFADHILDKVTVKSDHIEFSREYVGDGTQHTANTTESLRIYLHANNRGNNYISTGEYTCVGTGARVPTSAGTVNMRYTPDSYWYNHSTANTNSTLSVSFVNNEYVIIATINGETWGYKGMPDGWVAPSGSEEPELTALATPVLAVTVSGNTVTATWNDVTGAANYTVTLNGENKGTTTETSISFSDLKYSTDYTITVVANPADSTTNTVSEAASKTVKTEADPNAGGGDEPATDFINWHFSAHYNTSNRVVTLTGKDDSRVITVKTNELAFAKFYADTTRSSYFTDATVDGVATSDVTAESYVHVQQNQVSINLVINGITYTGNSDGFSY